MNTHKDVISSRLSPITSVLWSIATVLSAPAALASGALEAGPVRAGEAIRLTEADLVALQRRAKLPGVSAAVRCDGELIWAGSAGESAPGVPATPRTRYRVASISKVLTAGVAAVLAAQGRLDLDAPAGDLLPELSGGWAVPTSRQLLAHLGGAAHYRPWELENKPAFSSAREAAAVFVGRPIRAPGQRRYSSYGFVLAAAMMEAAGGADFLTLLTAEVLEPLGMHETGPDATGCAGCAVAYRRWPLRVRRPAAPVDLSYKWAAGGLSSTVLDLTAYGAAWLSPGWLDAPVLSAALTPMLDSEGAVTRNGLGWALYRDRRHGKVAAFGHGGSVLGGGAVLYVDRRTGVSVAILTNLRRRDVFTTADARRIAERFAGCREGL